MADENELAAALGRRSLECDRLKFANGQLLNAIASIVKGEIERSRVLVNLTDGTVIWTARGETPSLPAQINGLPIVVVAPPQTEVSPLEGVNADP